MKKGLKIFGVVVAALLLVLMVAPVAFKGKIESLIKSEGNKLLNAQFDFKDLNISLLRNFPLASVSLEDFYLKGIDKFENDTLVYAGELAVAVNVGSLIGGDAIEISKIIVNDTKLHAIVLEEGGVNWDVMKSSGSAEQPAAETEADGGSFAISLKKLSLDNVNLIYDDRQGGMYAEVSELSAACSGDFASDNTAVNLKAEAPAVIFRMGGVSFLNKASIKADIDADADLKAGKFTLKDNVLELNAIKAAVDGWLTVAEQSVEMDLKLNTNEVGFKEILSLVPAIYAKDFKGLKTDGSATLAAYAKGKLEGDIVPEFDVTLNVKNAMFRYPSLPAGVDGINIAANVKNPGGSLDATTIVVNPFNFSMVGNPFSLTAEVQTPISDPAFNASAKGKLDLGRIKDVYPIEDMNLNGVINADMTLLGRLSYIEKEQFDKVQAAGSIALSDMKLQMEGIPAVDIHNSVFSFSPRYLELGKTTINVGNNDITLDSRFENYLGFVLKGTTLKGSLNVSSKMLNLNDFIGDAEGEATPEQTATEQDQPQAATQSAEGVLRVPDNIDFRMQADFAKVLFDKMQFDNLKGLLVIKDSKVDMQNLSLNTMGGDVVVNGSYATLAGENPRLNAGFNLANIGFAQAYKDLDMIRSMAPIFEGLNGNFSGVVKVDTELDGTMSPILNTMNGSGSLSTKDLKLSGVKFIDQVADITKKPALKDIAVKDLKIDFAIVNGRINTKPFDLKLGDYVMNLSGSTGLDQSIDYRGKITIPASAGNISKLGTVDMTIGGTFAAPKVGIDMESLAKQAAQKAVENLGSKLLGGTKEAADSIDTAAPTEADKKKEVVGKVLNLFKKK